MSSIKFKTNINCSGCVNSITPHLNKIDSVKNWKVDTENPDKVLTVELEDDSSNAAQIIQVVEKAGFKISEMKEGLA